MGMIIHMCSLVKCMGKSMMSTLMCCLLTKRLGVILKIKMKMKDIINTKMSIH